MRRPKTTLSRAFTLIELLVVIAVIAVLAGVIGVGLSQGGEGAALAAGRGVFSVQFSAARSQAALAERDTSLVIVADPNDAERYLRHLAVAVDDAGIWRALNEGTGLPGDVMILPAESGSTLLPDTVTGVALDVGDELTDCYLIRFQSDGNPVASGGGELWFTLGEMTSTGLVAQDDAPIVKLVLSRYGELTEVAPEELQP